MAEWSGLPFWLRLVESVVPFPVRSHRLPQTSPFPGAIFPTFYSCTTSAAFSADLGRVSRSSCLSFILYLLRTDFFSLQHFLCFIFLHQDFFFSRGSVALISASKITSHNMTLMTVHHDWLTPSASHPIPVQYTSQILADPLSFTSHLYHFHSAQLTHSTTWQRGTPERGAALLRYRIPAVFKRARIAAPQILLSRPITAVS